MQVFNSINARKLENEFNVFSGFFNNPIFLIITLLTIVVQMILVEYGKSPVNCVPLTWDDNLKCLGISASMLVVGALVKLVPETLFEKFAPVKQEEIDDTDSQKLFINSFKNSFRDKLASENKDFKKLLELKKQTTMKESMAKHDDLH